MRAHRTNAHDQRREEDVVDVRQREGQPKEQALRDKVDCKAGSQVRVHRVLTATWFARERWSPRRTAIVRGKKLLLKWQWKTCPVSMAGVGWGGLGWAGVG